MDYQGILKSFQPEQDFFAGIDSDGCVFDSMEIKQREFFIPNALKHFNLEPISGILIETWEFVNLYSIHRGGNRFVSLIKVFELLSKNEIVRKSGQVLPDMHNLKQWVRKENKLGNTTLRKYYESNYDPSLEKVLLWSESINKEIHLSLPNIPPFPHALEALKKLSSSADIIIVSQTPLEALEREWKENNLLKYVKAIAGQEHGTKTEHIAMAALGKYEPARILMIGDAKGDLDAAKSNGILFYPIIPGNEDRSWERFIREGFEKFKKGMFRGKYEEELIRKFLEELPETR